MLRCDPSFMDFLCIYKCLCIIAHHWSTASSRMLLCTVFAKDENYEEEKNSVYLHA